MLDYILCKQHNSNLMDYAIYIYMDSYNAWVLLPPAMVSYALYRLLLWIARLDAWTLGPQVSLIYILCLWTYMDNMDYIVGL